MLWSSSFTETLQAEEDAAENFTQAPAEGAETGSQREIERPLPEWGGPFT